MLGNFAYSHRSANQQLSKKNIQKIKNKLQPLLAQLKNEQPQLTHSVHQVLEKSSILHKYLTDVSFLTLSGIKHYLQQCYHHKEDTNELKELEDGIEKLLENIYHEVYARRPNPHIHVIKNPSGVKPYQVAELSVTSEKGQLVLEWKDPLNREVQYYEVFIDNFTKDFQPIRLDVAPQKQSLLVEPWKMYNVGIRAVTDAGPGEWTSPRKIVNKTVPSNPSLPQVIKVTKFSIELGISHIEIENVTACIVQGIGSSCPKTFSLLTRQDTELDVIKLERLLPSTTYRIRIKLRNDQGESRELSEEIKVSTKEKSQVPKIKLCGRKRSQRKLRSRTVHENSMVNFLSADLPMVMTVETGSKELIHIIDQKLSEIKVGTIFRFLTLKYFSTLWKYRTYTIPFGFILLITGATEYFLLAVSKLCLTYLFLLMVLVLIIYICLIIAFVTTVVLVLFQIVITYCFIVCFCKFYTPFMLSLKHLPARVRATDFFKSFQFFC